MVVPSRRALLTFTRILSIGSEPYQCHRCMYRGRVASGSITRRPGTEIRHYGQTPTQNSKTEAPNIDEHHGSFLDFQLSRRQEDEARMPIDPFATESSSVKESHVSRKYVKKQLEQVEAGLEMTGLNIEELEDMLLEIYSKDVISTERGGMEEDNRPWQLREGDITEDEYSSIEALLNSNRGIPQSQLEIHRPKVIQGNVPETKVDIIPWYLREQQTDNSLATNFDIQQAQYEKYPDLPRDSPPLLQPLVSRLFYDHHLLNIVLLDLRNRDPPPVWGSNTIMILATVRSERQLSSVAEATSKWLKTIAGVIPRIDGLPKQENLVMKRRRLRKKSLRRPGYLMATPRPTTWVSMYTGYQGLVLQLFTEQGRQEYDLEELWGDSRVVDAEILDMKPRKARLGQFDEDERVETSLPTSKGQKKSVHQKKLEKERKKWEKMKEAKAAKKRWTKEEKEQARNRRVQEAAIFSSIGNAPVNMRARFGDRQQRRQIHTTRITPSFRLLI
jgi:ribosomal silencing factor RsfS